MGTEGCAPKRLLLVTNRLATGGAENMILTLARWADRTRLQPVVACLKDPGPMAPQFADMGVAVHADLLKHKLDLFVIEKLTSLILREGIDALCAVGSGGDRMFWSTLAARRTQHPMMVWSHLCPRAGDTHFERSNRALYRWVDTFVASGKRHREALVRHEHIPAGRTVVIRNGIDGREFDRPGLRDQARRELRLTDDQTVAVGIIANLRPDKRHDLFVQAAARVAPHCPRAVFIIIGEGGQRPSIEQKIAQSGLSGDRIRMLGRVEDLPLMMQGLDIVCLCSQWECLSIVMLEAMAAGRCFLAPSYGSLDEALVDHQTGRNFRPWDAESLASVLAEVINDPTQRKALGQRARAKVLSEFTAGQMASEIEDLVEKLCSTRRGSADGRPIRRADAYNKVSRST